MPFNYKKILVVGGTSGIGEAMAERFINNGTSVVVVGRRQENLEAFAKKHSQSSGQVDTAAFDITDLKGIPKFAQDITSKHPDLDCVFLNAGIQRHLNWKEPENVDLDLLETEFTTNYLSYMHLTKAFLPFLQKQAPKETSIVYVTSGLALVPIVYCPNYCASKAALHHMCLAMRLQMKEANSNVKIIELLPPAVQTELHDDKHQPEFKGKGRQLGMPLNDFVEEAWEGLNSSENEQVPVEKVHSAMGFYEWEQERQKKMVGMYEMMKGQR
ncbi:putative oxidoreductase DltE [Pseudocercospora fuligena]|uniref:Putative oxidoreductase DltE n=1 Tax=Pseudocercospora fuligena TaxID=685502 RepID=A0A8H6VEK5_9PEZI|nr:putative oxidoreductase DltE [Pseudocercospora fuligena]